MDTTGSPRNQQEDRIAVGKAWINDCVRYAAELNLLYLNNPKCGCTTVKHALWMASDTLAGKSTFASNVHDRKSGPFAGNPFNLPSRQRGKIAQTLVFSVVRNPFARALSAYADKVANDPAVWPTFLRRFGLKPTVGKNELSFADFLGLIAVAPDDILDGHFRPQCRNLLLPLARPVFIGCVENMAAVGDFLAAHGVSFRDEPMNATRTQDQFAAMYNSRTASLVRGRYAEDFTQFGYSTELADVRARPKTVPAMRDREDRLLQWLATGTRPPDVIEPADFFAVFARTREREKRLRIVWRAFAGEHDLSRLQVYANFVSTKSRAARLRDAIHDRMTALQRRYAEAISNPEIFVDFA